MQIVELWRTDSHTSIAANAVVLDDDQFWFVWSTICELQCVESACSITFAILGLLLMAGSVCLLFYVNWPKQYITASVNLNERKEYLSKTDEQIILQLISDAQNDFTKNNEILERKTICYKIAILLLIISTPLLILAII